MAKIIVNGQEVPPANKVKLEKYKTRTEIQKLIREKQKEQQDAKSSGN